MNFSKHLRQYRIWLLLTDFFRIQLFAQPRIFPFEFERKRFPRDVIRIARAIGTEPVAKFQDIG